MQNKTNEIMSADEIAQYLNTSRATAYRLLRSNKIPLVHTMPGRFGAHKADVLRYQQEQHNPKPRQ